MILLPQAPGFLYQEVERAEMGWKGLRLTGARSLLMAQIARSGALESE